MKLKTMVYYGTLFFKILIWLAIVQGKTDHHHWKSHRSRHISGSHPAPPGRWKFMALLVIETLNKTKHICSAILISQQSLLTAGHCCKNAEKITILFKGMPESALKFKHRDDVLFRITDSNHVKFHPLYTISNFWAFDIAIVKLRSALQLDPKNGLDKIELSPSKSEAIGYSYDPHDCYLLGYGLENPEYTDIRLQQAKIPILSNKYCRMSMPDWNAQLQVCIGYERKYSKKEIPKSSMPGDSGGAIVCKTRRMVRSQSERYPRIPKYCLVAVNTGEYKNKTNFGRKYIIMTVGVRIHPKLDWILMNL